MDDATAGSSGYPRRVDVGRGRPVNSAPLPYGKAFVVQFTSETDQNLEHATGRIEHLESGRRVFFSSATELLACIVVMLTDVDQAERSETATEPPPGG